MRRIQASRVQGRAPWTEGTDVQRPRGRAGWGSFDGLSRKEANEDDAL